MASYSLEHLPVAMDVGTCKITGNLLIIVACQYFKGNERKTKGKDRDKRPSEERHGNDGKDEGKGRGLSEEKSGNEGRDKSKGEKKEKIAIKRKDKGKGISEEMNDISIIEVDYKNGWTCRRKHHIKPDKRQITKLIYDENYGLIMGCYRGYIERFDIIKFESIAKWDNNLKAVGSDK